MNENFDESDAEEFVPVQQTGSGKEAQIMYSLDEVKREDPEIAEAIEQEMQRQNDHIELIASENWVSKAVMAAMIRGRISRTPLLRRLPVRGRRGNACH